ncbi:MAG: hypothetical protein D6732_28250 [Methanobacteriota archaeon]|nr:MAG: hypothetical protein D6732_28250 [Euryarchaeota archaeon]
MNDPKVLIKLEAMAKMIQFDKDHPKKETAGLLIGRYIEDENVLIIEDIEVGDQKGTAVHVEISEQALVDIVVKMSQRQDGATIVGWWHTHPGLRSFMSSTDISTQRNYQNLFDKSVAIVIDPLKYQSTLNIADLDFGVYRVKGNDYYKIPYEVIDAVPLALSLYFQREPPKTPVVRFDHDRLKSLKEKIRKAKDIFSSETLAALNAWIEAVETLEEVPLTKSTNPGDPVSQLYQHIEKIESAINYGLAEKINREGKEAFLYSLGLMLILSVLFFIFI